MFRAILKVLGLLLLALLLGTGIVWYTAANYSTYELKADPSRFPGVQTQEQIDSLAWALIGQMSLNEKLAQLSGESTPKVLAKFVVNIFGNNKFPHIYSGRNERLGIPPYVLSDGPRGAVVGDGPATAFPVAMARAAAWSPELEMQVADVVGKEMRAMGTNYNAAPCINLLRHPGWGRAQETYGEDPWLMGELGVAYTRGVQQHNVMACPKHFALNSVENARFYINATADERTLHEVYFPHFKKVIQEGQAASIMSAYNQVNGEYCGQNEYLLTEVLRKQWGFEGYVSTDWFYGLRDGVKGARAGQNSEMPARNHFGKPLKKAVKDGVISEARIDTLVFQVLRTKLRYALAPDPMTYDASVLATDEHTALARKVAEESMVLLKNESILPFPSPSGKKVLVVGYIADTVNTGDQGSSYVRKVKYVVTPLDGIGKYVESKGGQVQFVRGDNLGAAQKAAASADMVIVVAGFTQKDEGEYITTNPADAQGPPPPGARIIGGDRPSLRLRARDEALILGIAGQNPQTVVALVGGSAITMETWKNDVPAILMAWYAGMEGGTALARVLFGEVNPGGKLPFTIPVNESDLPEFDPFAYTVNYGYYHGYTLFDKKNLPAAFPFGFGLSYTTFRFDSLKVLTPDVFEGGEVKAEVWVKNTGKMAGAEVAQLYIGFDSSAIDRPVKLLRSFKKVYLNPGDSVKVTFSVPAKELTWYDPATKTWKLEFRPHQVYVGNSSAQAGLLKGVFYVKEEAEEVGGV